MIEEIRITSTGVEYDLTDEAPTDAREQLADAGNPTNPSVASNVIEQS